MSTQAMITNAIASLWARSACSLLSSATRCTLRAPSEQAGRPDQKNDCHDDEDHGVGGFGKEDLRQSLDETQAESGQNRAHDRSYAADHDHREYHDNEVRTHLRAHVVD